MIAVLLAGGSGTRFWPLSRELHPKQLQNLIGDRTLIQATFARLLPLVRAEDIYVLTHRDHAYQTCQQLAALGFDPSHLVAEPAGRNTAPSIALIARLLEARGNEVMALFPADHQINDTAAFHTVLRQAEARANAGDLVTLGIPPTRPETGYGYIACGAVIDPGPARRVERFIEKPDADTAQAYLNQGGYLWNAGIYLGTVSTFLEEIAQWMPKLNEALRSVRDHLIAREGPHPFLELDDPAASTYEQLDSVSVDYAMMEHSRRLSVVPAEMGWCDVGSWDVLDTLMATDAAGNAAPKNVVLLDCADNIIHGDQRLIAVLGVEHLILVDTPDALMVCRKDRAQDVKQLVDLLRENRRQEIRAHTTVYKPWGSYTVLARQNGYLVKRIEVLPGETLSLQAHRHRGEHWVVTSGTAEVERAGETFRLEPDASTYIPKGTRHRLGNPGNEPLVLVEIQTGEVLSEDDITRFEDKYGRTDPSGETGAC